MQPNDSSTSPKGASPLAVQLLTSLEKTLRSYRLYEARGPQYEAHMGGLKTAIAAATEQGAVAINLSPFGPYLDGQTAPTEGDYARQWFDLFEEGARQIVFNPGITTDEVRELMHVFCGDDYESEDIVTALWRKNLHHITVQVARVLVRHLDVGLDKAKSLEEELGRWRQQLGGIDHEGGVEFVQEERHIALQQDDFRLLAMNEKTFDWCRIAREPPVEVQTDARRPRLAEDIDRQIVDYERFLDLVDASRVNREELLLNVLVSLTHFGNTEDLARFLEVLTTHEGIGSKAVKRIVDDKQILERLVPVLQSAPDVFTGSIEAFAAMQVEILPDSDGDESLSEMPTVIIETIDEDEYEDGGLEVYQNNIFSPNPRTACDAVNALFAKAEEESIQIALEAYTSKSVSVRQLVVIHVLRKSLSDLPESLSANLEDVILKAMKDTDKGIRQLVFKHFLKHSDEARISAVIQLMGHLGFTGRDLSERTLMLDVVSRADHQQEVVDFLCNLLLKYRLFSSGDEMNFQTEVAKRLIRSDNPKAAKSITKVLKRWTVPSQVKTMIREELESYQKEQSDGEEDE